MFNPYNDFASVQRPAMMQRFAGLSPMRAPTPELAGRPEMNRPMPIPMRRPMMDFGGQFSQGRMPERRPMPMQRPMAMNRPQVPMRRPMPNPEGGPADMNGPRREKFMGLGRFGVPRQF